MRRIRFRISRSMHGHPTFTVLDFHRQYSLNPIRCHLMIVSCCTITSACRQSGQSLERHAQKTRSRGRSFERLTKCLQTTSYCRRAKFSLAKWTLGMSIARRFANTAFSTPILASLPIWKSTILARRWAERQSAQVLDSSRERN